MLRITFADRGDATTVALEGRLAGPWVDELTRSWAELTSARRAAAISVDLDSVTFIDDSGRALLQRMHDEGAALVASGCMTCGIVAEIRKQQPAKSPRRP